MNDFLLKYQGELSQDQIDRITRLGVTELAKEIRQGKLKSREATLAFSLRSIQLNPHYKFLADTNFDLALSQADTADWNFNMTTDKSTLPELHGVPISLKENFNLSGFKSTRGYMINALKEKDNSDSYIAEVLKRKGAILFTKTNVPQALLSYESSNLLYGHSRNPWNRQRISGGSSGGESSIISSFCSPGGIGTDIAGSIRVPCNFCGLYGLKPTANRLSGRGGLGINNGSFYQPIVPGGKGPMVRNMEDLILMTRNLFGEFTDDHECYPLKFNESKLRETRKLKIGYCLELPICETADGIKSEISKTISKFKEMHKDYEVVEFPLDQFYESIVYTAYELFLNTSIFETIEQTIKGEKPLKSYEGILKSRTYPRFVFNAWAWIQYLIGNRRKAWFMTRFRNYTSVWQFIEEYNKLQVSKSNFYNYFKQKGFDAIILPVLNHVAPEVGKIGDVQLLGHMCSIFNVLDMPSGSLPIGLLGNTDYTTKYNDNYSRSIKECLKGSSGLPIGLQVACLPCDDELCLRIMNELDQVNRFSTNFSHRVLDIIAKEIKN